MDHEGLRVSLVAGGNNLKGEDLPQYIYSEKTGRLNWRNIMALRVGNPNLFEDPAFEDLIKNFISSRLVESDLEKIGDERMLRVLLLDQLLLENLLALQDHLVADVSNQENRLAVSVEQQQEHARQLERNNSLIEENRAQIGLKKHQLEQLKGHRQQLSAFKCTYCGKLFKNLQYLERHLVTKEAHNLLLEKESELANEHLMRQQREEQDAKTKLQQEELRKREEEHRNLMQEVQRLKSLMDQDSSEKMTMKKQLENVNHELSTTAGKISQMESELADKVKEIERIKRESEEKSQTQTQALAKTMDLLQKTKAEVSQLAAQQSTAHTAPPPATIGGSAASPMAVDTDNLSKQAPAKPADLPPNPVVDHKADPPKPTGPSDTIIELTTRLLTRDPKLVLAQDMTWDPSKPNPQIIKVVLDLLQSKGFSTDDPVGVGPGKASSSMLFPVLVDGLVEKKILLPKDPVIDTKTKLIETTPPIQTKDPNLAGKFKGSLADDSETQKPADGSTLKGGQPAGDPLQPSPQQPQDMVSWRQQQPTAIRPGSEGGLDPTAPVQLNDGTLGVPTAPSQLEQSQHLTPEGQKVAYYSMPNVKFDSLTATKLSIADLKDVLDHRGDLRLLGSDAAESRLFSASRFETSLRMATQYSPQDLDVMTAENLVKALGESRKRLETKLTEQTQMFSHNKVDYKFFHMPRDLLLNSEPRVDLVNDPSSKVRDTMAIAGLFGQQLKKQGEDQKFLNMGAFNIGELLTEKKYQEERQEIDKKRTSASVPAPAKPPQAPGNPGPNPSQTPTGDQSLKPPTPAGSLQQPGPMPAPPIITGAQTGQQVPPGQPLPNPQTNPNQTSQTGSGLTQQTPSTFRPPATPSQPIPTAPAPLPLSQQRSGLTNDPFVTPSFEPSTQHKVPQFAGQSDPVTLGANYAPPVQTPAQFVPSSIQPQVQTAKAANPFYAKMKDFEDEDDPMLTLGGGPNPFNGRKPSAPAGQPVANPFSKPSQPAGTSFSNNTAAAKQADEFDDF